MSKLELQILLCEETDKEIKEIIKYCELLSMQNLSIKPTVYKKAVPLFILKNIAESFSSPIVEKDDHYNTPAYVAIKNHSYNIIVQLETKS